MGGGGREEGSQGSKVTGKERACIWAFVTSPPATTPVALGLPGDSVRLRRQSPPRPPLTPTVSFLSQTPCTCPSHRPSSLPPPGFSQWGRGVQNSFFSGTTNIHAPTSAPIIFSPQPGASFSNSEAKSLVLTSLCLSYI